MNIFKKTLATVVMMSALISTSALANSAGDAKVRAAGETTLAKTEEAVNLLEKNGDKAEILKLLGEVRQSQKEFRYEQTERLRQKAGDKLRLAHEALTKDDNADATSNLKAALDFYKEMFVVYKKAH
ncbi:hypothetical protein [Methylomonas sp. AM2-LC]|uniref:hypothetical protein n=1 Tax=Methylomonas sp. AM2-LC TaxID=3153301 RepID=UPI003263679B